MFGGEGVHLSVVERKVNVGKAGRTYKKLKVTASNFSGLCNECKQKKVAELLII